MKLREEFIDCELVQINDYDLNQLAKILISNSNPSLSKLIDSELIKLSISSDGKSIQFISKDGTLLTNESVIIVPNNSPENIIIITKDLMNILYAPESINDFNWNQEKKISTPPVVDISTKSPDTNEVSGLRIDTEYVNRSRDISDSVKNNL